MTNKTHPTLLERIRDGTDVLAWEEFSRRYGWLLFAYSKHRGCSDHTAEEVVQDVMLTVFQQKDAFRYDPGRGRFRDWLGVLVRNRVSEYRRRPNGRDRAIGGENHQAVESLEVRPEARPDAAWETAFEHALLLAMIDVVRRDMRPRTYQAFELFALNDVPAAEVAQRTGLTRNAVYQAGKEVRKRLCQLGATYRKTGQLGKILKEAILARPAETVRWQTQSATQDNRSA